jgi:hypothetical protein
MRTQPRTRGHPTKVLQVRGQDKVTGVIPGKGSGVPFVRTAWPASRTRLIEFNDKHVGERGTICRRAQLLIPI